MKQCPECNELFDSSMNYCELDGVALVDQATEIREILHPAPLHTGPNISGTLATVVIGVLIGVVVTLLGLVVFIFPIDKNKAEAKRESVTQSTSPRPEMMVGAPRERQTPFPEVSPTPEVEAPASPSPVPVAATSPEPAVAAMNEGPISTGTKRGPENSQAVIKMKDGSSVEADAAWEDSQGVWYRRGNMVAFVERSKVEKITAASTRRPAATDEARP
jgi:cell division protein FtsN